MPLFKIEVSGDNANQARVALAQAGIRIIGPSWPIVDGQRVLGRTGKELLAYPEAASPEEARDEVAALVGDGFTVEIGRQSPLNEMTSNVVLSDQRLAVLINELSGRNVDCRSPVQLQGPLAAGPVAREIDVGGQQVTVPEPARANALAVGTEPGEPGILIEAGAPEPAGTWIWVRCDATGHANWLLRALSNIE